MDRIRGRSLIIKTQSSILKRSMYRSVGTTSWKQPSIYFRITIALIYPLVLGFFLSCLRLLRLGTTIDVISIMNINVLTLAILLIMLFPYTLGWILILKLLTQQLYYFLWQQFLILLKSIIFRGLQYRIVFKILEFIHKISFIWISFMIYHPFIYRKPQSFLRYYLHFIYVNPITLYLAFAFIGIAELVVTKGQLYYSLHMFLIFLILRPFFYILNSFNTYDTDWVEFCCYSNYLYRSWDKAYYPRRFWIYFNNIYNNYNQMPKIDNELLPKINESILIWTNKQEEIFLRDYHIENRLLKKNISLKHRIRFSYRKWSKI